MTTTFWIQFLGVVFGTSMMYFTYVKFKKKELSKTELYVWFSGWTIMVLLAVRPSTLDFAIEGLHFYRRLDFFVVVGFFVLLGLGFYNYSVSKKMERKMEVLVRKEAMKEEKD